STASFFRTHPPYAERILSTFRELSYLPEGLDLQVDSRRFQEAQREMLKKHEELHKEGGQRPSLKRYPDCPPDEETPEVALETPTERFTRQ
ncbi:MAG: hypothetical protein ACKOB4_15575, partial [Acidobacteriota bacterium]